METVFVTWRKRVRIIFKVPYNTHCYLVHLIAEAPSVKVHLHRRFLKFYISLCKSNNPLVAMMSKFVSDGSQSASCKFSELHMFFVCFFFVNMMSPIVT